MAKAVRSAAARSARSEPVASSGDRAGATSRKLQTLSAGGDVRGSLDTIDAGVAFGWAMSPAEPSRRLRVELWDGNDVIAMGDAALPRSDLIDGRIGDGHCAFSIRLPSALYDGAQHMIAARVAGSATALSGS